MLVDRVLNFQPPPFRDLGSTDGAAPDAAAGLQAAVMGRAVLFALPDPHPSDPLILARRHSAVRVFGRMSRATAWRAKRLTRRAIPPQLVISH